MLVPFPCRKDVDSGSGPLSWVDDVEPDPDVEHATLLQAPGALPLLQVSGAVPLLQGDYDVFVEGQGHGLVDAHRVHNLKGDSSVLFVYSRIGASVVPFSGCFPFPTDPPTGPGV